MMLIRVVYEKHWKYWVKFETHMYDVYTAQVLKSNLLYTMPIKESYVKLKCL
jgi:hypothetical protein